MKLGRRRREKLKMTCMVMIDSSVIIEGLKASSQFPQAQELLEIAILNSELFSINEMVIDEVLYWLLKKRVNISKYRESHLLTQLRN